MTAAKTMQVQHHAPWFDLQRFPGRAHLASVVRQHRADPEPQRREAQLQLQVIQRWSAQLRCDPSDLLLLPSADAAIRLALSALLAPGDVAIVAEPMPGEWLAGVLQTGARFVDVGRRAAGDIDPAALRLALERHPDAVAVGLTPSWFATDDREAWQGLEPRARLMDARHSSQRAAREPGDTAVLVALRDEEAGGQPALYGIATAPGTGSALALLGVDECGLPALERAARILDSKNTLVLAGEAGRQARYRRFAALLAAEPGVRVWPRAGTCAAAECLAGNARDIALRVCASLPGVAAFDTPAMRHLLVVDLAAVAFDRQQVDG